MRWPLPDHDQRNPEVCDVCDTELATGGRRDSESFDEIVASLSTSGGAASRPATASRRASGRARLLRTSVLLLLLGWLVLELGWPGVLIACGVGAGMVEMHVRRRRNRK
jgi:hypothetical protein